MWLFQSSSESLRWFGKGAISQTHLFFLKVLLHSGKPPYCICLNFNMYLFKSISYWFVTITILPNFSCCESFIALGANLFCENAHITSLKGFLQNNRQKVKRRQGQKISEKTLFSKSSSRQVPVWDMIHSDELWCKYEQVKFYKICQNCNGFLS